MKIEGGMYVVFQIECKGTKYFLYMQILERGKGGFLKFWWNFC